MFGTEAGVRQNAPSLGWESLAIFAICLADTVSTAILVGLHIASEANPIMAKCLDQGPMTFFFVKMSWVFALVVLAESHRRSNPVFVSKALKFVIVAYLLMYTSAVYAINFR